MTSMFSLYGFTVLQHDAVYSAYDGFQLLGSYKVYEEMEEDLRKLNSGNSSNVIFTKLRAL